MARARWNVKESAPDTEIPATTRVIAVASGKGGVGKSSVTVNLAAALAAQRPRGSACSTPTSGASRSPACSAWRAASRAPPRTRRSSPTSPRWATASLEVVSMGFLVDKEESALMWRGLMLNRAVQHFLEDVRWGDLDYLLIDMPPGTGDVQMGLARMLPRTEVLIVTTPGRSAQKVAVRAADMARKSLPAHRRGHREHERLRLRARRVVPPLRRGRGRGPGPRGRRAPARLDPARAGRGRRRRRGPADRPRRRARRRGLPRAGHPHRRGGRAAGRDGRLQRPGARGGGRRPRRAGRGGRQDATLPG